MTDDADTILDALMLSFKRDLALFGDLAALAASVRLEARAVRLEAEIEELQVHLSRLEDHRRVVHALVYSCFHELPTHSSLSRSEPDAHSLLANSSCSELRRAEGLPPAIQTSGVKVAQVRGKSLSRASALETLLN